MRTDFFFLKKKEKMEKVRKSVFREWAPLQNPGAR